MEKYLVGGAVRNKLLKLPIKEKDWVVTGTTPQEMLNIGFQQVGKDFPVFLHPDNHEEYALARTERKTGKGYTGFTCYTSPKITLKEDLYRRDLTINAIAIDEKGNLIDPYQGQKDIKLRILRHVSHTFYEDPLRVLRVARFAATFFHLNFKIAPDTLLLMKNMSKELNLITPERIWMETKKALETKNPQIYFQVLHSCGALEILFPEIEALFGVPAPIKWHPEIDTGIHTMMALSIVANLTNDTIVRFATLCHDLGKGITPKNQLPSHHGHGQAGVVLISNLCKRLKIPKKMCNLAKIAAKHHDILHNIQKLTPKMLLSFFNEIDVWRKPERLHQIIYVGESDLRGRKGFDKKKYPQKIFLNKAFKITKKINTSQIIKEGFKGVEIHKELNLRRKKALTIWKNKKLTKNKNKF